jgi:GNAT superfamily N-acetyltransferase
MADKPETRPATSADAEGILSLRREVFGNLDPVRCLPAAWRWQYGENPSGPGIVWIAKDGGRVVAHYAVIPARMLVDGKEALYAFSCDTMVAPGYRRRGLFVDLARKTYAQAIEERGVRWIWGFPNARSMPGFVNQLAWNDLGRFPSYITLSNPFSGAGQTFQSQVPGYPGARILPVKHFDQDHTRLFEARAPRAGVVQIRDAAYLNWRYTALPDFGYMPFAVYGEPGMEGWFVLRPLKVKGLRVLALVDMFPLPLGGMDLTRAVFAWIRRHAAREGLGSVVTALFPKRLETLAKSCGFVKVPRVFSPKEFRLACLASPDGPWSNVNSAAWRIMLGDTDIV